MLVYESTVSYGDYVGANEIGAPCDVYRNVNVVEFLVWLKCEAILNKILV